MIGRWLSETCGLLNLGATTSMVAVCCLCGPAFAADMKCRFVTECVDDACTETSYAFDVEMAEMAATITTPAETLSGRVGLTGGGAPFVVAVTDGAVHLLTMMDAAGTARYTVHLAGAGMAVTYLGRCESE